MFMLTKFNVFLIIYAVWVLTRFCNFSEIWEDMGEKVYIESAFLFYPINFLFVMIHIISMPTVIMGILYLIIF